MTTTQPHLILASQSPRRQQLLADAGFTFEVIVPLVDEEKLGKCSDCGPAELVAELAFRKADDVIRRIAANQQILQQQESSTAIIVAGDTVAECGGQILGKPRDEEDATVMLKMMSGQRHRVFSGICLWPLPQAGGAVESPLVEVDMTTLVMDELSPSQLETYIASGDWTGKAGAFGYQDGLDWVHIVEGSESNVVGLPMERLANMLQQLAKTTL